MKKILLSIGVLFLVGCGIEPRSENIEELDMTETEQGKRENEIMERKRRQEEYKRNTEYGVEEDLFKSGPVMSKRMYTTMTYYFPGTPQTATMITPEPHPFLFANPFDPSTYEEGPYEQISDYIQKKEGSEYTFSLPFLTWRNYASQIMFELPVELSDMKHARAIVTTDGQDHIEMQRLHILAIDYSDNLWHFEDSLTYNDTFMQKVNMKFIWGDCESELAFSWRAAFDCLEDQGLSGNENDFIVENEEEILRWLNIRLDMFVRKIRFSKQNELNY